MSYTTYSLCKVSLYHSLIDLIMTGQIYLPTLRNCTLEFLKEILAGQKKYFLLSEIAMIRVPLCPEITVERILKLVKDHKEVMNYLPDISDKAK